MSTKWLKMGLKRGVAPMAITRGIRLTKDGERSYEPTKNEYRSATTLRVDGDRTILTGVGADGAEHSEELRAVPFAPVYDIVKSA